MKKNFQKALGNSGQGSTSHSLGAWGLNQGTLHTSKIGSPVNISPWNLGIVTDLCQLCVFHPFPVRKGVSGISYSSSTPAYWLCVLWGFSEACFLAHKTMYQKQKQNKTKACIKRSHIWTSGRDYCTFSLVIRLLSIIQRSWPLSLS